MSNEEALIREILANPEDRKARLIYADWLDERGDPRGAYVRLLCAAVTWDGDPDGRLRQARAGLDLNWLEQMHRGLARGGLEFSGFDTHCHLRLDSGRVVRLRGLNQNLTYSGLLEGTPTRDLNDDLIQRAMSEGRDHGAGRRVRLIEPPRRSDDHWSPEKRGLFAEAGIILEWLPAVTCVGWFGDADSELAVVWFQEEFAPPICQPVLVQLRKLDWTTEAHPWTEDNL